MKTLKDMLESDFGTVADWLEANYDKYYLVPKDFLSEDTKEGVHCGVEAVNEHDAPRGEIWDSLDEIEEVMNAVAEIIEGDKL